MIAGIALRPVALQIATTTQNETLCDPYGYSFRPVAFAPQHEQSAQMPGQTEGRQIHREERILAMDDLVLNQGIRTARP